MNARQLPNCGECHDNKEVKIVEALADDEYSVIYRVCCSACGGDWLWRWEIPQTVNSYDTWEGEHEIPICEFCHGTGQDWDLTPCGECDGEGYQYWL